MHAVENQKKGAFEIIPTSFIKITHVMFLSLHLNNWNKIDAFKVFVSTAHFVGGRERERERFISESK